MRTKRTKPVDRKLPQVACPLCPASARLLDRQPGTTEDDVLRWHFIDRHLSEYGLYCACGRLFETVTQLQNHLQLTGIRFCLAEQELSRAAGTWQAPKSPGRCVQWSVPMAPKGSVTP